MALGRSAPMLTSASPGRAAAMVPAPVARSQLPGHRQRSPNSAALNSTKKKCRRRPVAAGAAQPAGAGRSASERAGIGARLARAREGSAKG
jgi:hypothetical protein